MLLPPYAPELNPMENVWDYLRGNKLSSRVWNTYHRLCENATNFSEKSIFYSLRGRHKKDIEK